MRTFVLLNGPPRAGKDTAGRMLAAALINTGRSVSMSSIAWPMYEAAASVLGWPVSRLHERKDRPIDGSGATPRDLLIALSENLVVPTLGEDHWVRLMYEREMRRTGVDVTIVTDLGFEREVRFMVDRRDEGACRFVVVHVRRPGRDFSADSRSWVGYRCACGLDNDGDLDLLNDRVLAELAPLVLKTSRVAA